MVLPFPVKVKISHGNLARLWNSPLAGLFFLFLAFCIGFAFRYIGFFTADEGDNIAIGFLFSKGSLLYRDVFTHHMPFPYFWIAAVVKFIPSIKAVRLSVLVFQLAAFALVMISTRSYGPTGLAALVWSVIGHHFYANMALYHVFSGAALVVVFTVTLIAATRQSPLTRLELIVLGISAAIALLSDPVTIFLITIAVIALVLSRTGLKRAALAILSLGAVLAFFFLYLIFTRSLDDFYRAVILFNTTTYGQYYDSSPAHLLNIPGLLLKGLWIFDAGKWTQPEMLFISGDYPPLVRYLLGWFIYRLSLIAFSLLLLFRRQWLAAVFVYLFAAGTLIRSDGFFRQIPFVLVSLIAAAWFIFDAFKPGERENDGAKNFRYNLPSFVRPLVGSVIGFFFFWFVVSTLLYRFHNQNTLSYFDRFGQYESRTAEIKAHTCNQEVALGYFPGNPLIYFYTGFRPVSKYVYLWPWVAEIGLPEVISSLQTEKAIVFIDKDTSIWGNSARVYLAELIDYLDANYILTGGFYLSPSLASDCKDFTSMRREVR